MRIADNIPWVSFSSVQIFAQSEFIWSLFGLLLLLFTLTPLIIKWFQSRSISINRRNRSRHAFFLFSFLGFLFLFLYGALGYHKLTVGSHDWVVLSEVRQYSYTLGYICFEVAFASIVLATKTVHKILSLKTSHQEQYWGLFIVFQCLSSITISVVQLEYLKEKYRTWVFMSHVLNFLFSCVNLTAYSMMYWRFRKFITCSTEKSLIVHLSSAAACRHFGWFIMAYIVYWIFLLLMCVVTIADIFNVVNDDILSIFAIAAMFVAPTRFYAFICGCIFFRASWTVYLDAVKGKLDLGMTITNRSSLSHFVTANNIHNSHHLNINSNSSNEHRTKSSSFVKLDGLEEGSNDLKATFLPDLEINVFPVDS